MIYNMDFKEFCQQYVTLRNYQQKAKKEIFRWWDVANNRYLLVQVKFVYSHPSSTTLTYGDFDCILIIAHKSELIKQYSNSLSQHTESTMEFCWNHERDA